MECAARPKQDCVAVELALAFADGQVAGDVRADIEQRIDGCARCRGIVAEAARGTAGAAVSVAAAASPESIAIPRTISERRAKRRAPSIPPLSLEPGEQVGRYVVERSIGAGGMGFVSLARDPELKRPVVIKLVRIDVWGDESREELEARLKREAQAMARLSHPNVVQIFDIGRHGDRVFIAMEYVKGQTLDAWLPLQRDPARILALMRQAGAGLDAAHQAGLVHRDFKPANVLVGTDGIPKVTDFGLARVPRAPGPAITRPMKVSAPSGGQSAVLTAANVIIGTPAYMAPEQSEGGTVDARSDQYAFAVVLLDALVPQSPIKRVVEPGSIHMADSLGHVSPRVRAAIVRALSADPAARFPAMTELIAELEPAKPRAKWPIPVAGLALCGAAAVVWFATRGSASGPACVAEASRVWTPEARAAVIAAYGNDPRPFASWTGASVATEIDRAADRLATAEVMRCQGMPTVDDVCLGRRRAALATAQKPTADPWPLVRAIDSCEPIAPSPRTAELRTKLESAREPAALAALAKDARTLGDFRLAAAAHEAAALVALDREDMAGAQELLLAELEDAERANDDAARGRGRLYLLDVARFKGDLPAAKREDDALRAIYSRQPADPRAELAIAMREAATFGDLGDIKRAGAAWDVAIAQARALRAPDDELRVLAGRAWARHAWRFDLAGARVEIANILEIPTLAGPPARAYALTVQGDLALVAGDAAAAATAFREAAKEDPARAKTVAHRIRALRARGLSDPTGAIAELDKLAGSPVIEQRRDFAKAQIRRAAGRAREAKIILLELTFTTRSALSELERIDLFVERCAAEIDLGEQMVCGDDNIAAKLHEQAPARARLHLAQLRAARANTEVTTAKTALKALIPILEANDAPAIQVAELRWELARNKHGGTDDERRALAKSARAAYVVAKRDVAEIDHWLANPIADEVPVPVPVDAGVDEPSRRGPEP